MGADVLGVGAVPAGLATRIAARLPGVSLKVVDFRRPPIDKTCGESLLPQYVVSLQQLFIELNFMNAYPWAGERCGSDDA